MTGQTESVAKRPRRPRWRSWLKGTGLGSFKSLPGLAVLYLDRSAITDEALGHLATATNLQVLSIAGVPLTGRGLHHLKAVPKLEQLNIQGCGLEFEDIDDFRRARPAVRLE